MVSSLVPRLAANRPPKQYEFPTGYNAYFGAERYIPGELYFNHAHLGVRVMLLDDVII